MSSKIKPIKSVSLVEQVEQRILEFLKENRFKSGDSLPGEIELAENLGVSRNIVRESLSRLRMFGVVESKKRKGMFIAEPDILSGIERIMDPDLLGEEAMQHIFELRLVLEVGMSELLFIRKNSSDINNLEEIVDREANDPLCKTDLKTRLAYEIEFHSYLYKMSGNGTLNRFQSMLLPVFHYMMQRESKSDAKPVRGTISHKDLVETLRNGTAYEFRENMRNHLTPHFSKLS